MKKYLKSLFKMSMLFVTVGTIMMLFGFLFGGVGELSSEVSELVRVVRTGVAKTVERIPMLESITNINGFTLVVDIDKDEVSVSVNEEYETLTGDYKDLELAQADEVKKMDISIMCGSLLLLPSENGQYGVENKGEEEFQCYIEDETLYLSVFPGKTYSAKEQPEMILYIPEGEEYEQVLLFCSGNKTTVEVPLTGSEMQISAICGDNTFTKEMEFEHFVSNVGVGTFHVQQLSAADVDVEVSTAEAVFDTMMTDVLDVRVGMGILDISGDTTDDISVNCGMGEIRLKLNGAQNDYNYDISGSAESVQIGTDTLAGMVMERWIDNGADKKITMSCAMGNVKIGFNR